VSSATRICGVHPVFEAISSRKQPVERIHISRDAPSGKIRQIIGLAREHGIPVRREERSVIERLAAGQSHQGIVAIVGQTAYGSFEELFNRDNPLILTLDGVEDPHNLGAVIRSAEACGASGVVVTERHSAPLTAAVVKASAGATAYVPVIRVGNLVHALRTMKDRGLWIVGIDPSAGQLWTQIDYRGPTALVLGGEHRGLRRLVRESCDFLVKLPMIGKIESLNISVAAAVVLYEVLRQRDT